MPRGDKGKRFEKGNPGGGRPKIDPAVKELRELDRTELERTVREAMQLTENQIKKRLEDPECQAKERLALRIILRGIAKGDHSVLNFLADFTFGERPKKIHFQGQSNVMLGQMSKEAVRKLFKEVEDEV